MESNRSLPHSPFSNCVIDSNAKCYVFRALRLERNPCYYEYMEYITDRFCRNVPTRRTHCVYTLRQIRCFFSVFETLNLSKYLYSNQDHFTIHMLTCTLTVLIIITVTSCYYILYGIWVLYITTYI